MTEKQKLRLEDKNSIAEVMANQLCEEFNERIIVLCTVTKYETSIQTAYKFMYVSYDETELTAKHILASLGEAFQVRTPLSDLPTYGSRVGGMQTFGDRILYSSTLPV